MSLIQFPPEDIVTKMVPLLCRVVGIVFIGGGIFELVLIPVIFFAKSENIAVFALVLFGGAVFSIGVGIVVIKYMPKFMLSRFQKLRAISPF